MLLDHHNIIDVPIHNCKRKTTLTNQASNNSITVMNFSKIKSAESHYEAVSQT